MSGTKGTLYFIGEWDVFTGEQSPYTKIGIVKDEREVKSREKDHRTGNPRRLDSLKDIQALYVQTLETYLHNTLAKFRVGSGEWFQLDKPQLEAQMKRAEELAKELADSESTMEAAEVLSDLEHRSGTSKPNQELLQKHHRLASVQEELKTLKKQEKQVKDLLVENFAGLKEWSHLFKTGERKESVTFDGTAFKKAHPELHAKFVFPKTSWSHELVAPEAPLETIDAVELNIDAIKEDPIELHQKFLEIWAAKAELNWEETLLEATLISACSEHIEIEGVLTWEEKTRNTFDKAAMLAEHPEFEKEFSKVTEAKITYSPAEWASYKV
jgi:hypothetical protein